MERRVLLWFLGAIAVSWLLGWVASESVTLRLAQSSRPATTILVSAAASLQEALQAIKPAFERSQPNIRVSYNFGSSGALLQQIQQGAPADIFFSAGVPQMDALEKGDRLLAGTRRNFLGNRLVLVVPRNLAFNLSGFGQLTNSRVKKIAVGEFRSVPAGQYAEQVLTNLGILEQLRPKLVFANSVRAVLAAVARGNADAGVVYASDVKICDRVKAVATAPENLHQPIVYPVAMIKDSKHPDAASAFWQFLQGDRAKTIFQQFGFQTS